MLAITQCQHYYAPLLITILRTYTGIKSVDDDQALDFNDKEENRVELEDVLSQKILKDREVTHGRDCILIATVLLYILYYTRNQPSNIWQVMVGYFVYTDNTTKRIIENFYCMSFLVIYETV